MGLTLHEKNGKRRKMRESDRLKLAKISLRISARQEKAEKVRMEKVKEFNRAMRKKHGRHKLKCCDSCDKLFVIKAIKETSDRRGGERGGLSSIKVLTSECPYCRNEVTLKEEYLRPLPDPILIYPG